MVDVGGAVGGTDFDGLLAGGVHVGGNRVAGVDFVAHVGFGGPA